MTALVQASGLSLPGRLAEVSIGLEAGEIACLVGPNGSGKTSLIHALAGIGSPSGSVRIAEAELSRLPVQHRRRLLSFMPASRDIRWPLSARAVIALGGATVQEVYGAICRLQLAGLAERRVDRLSTGERSRVLLARALAPRPKLLLLDEPLANLDPQWQLRLIDLLREEVRGGEQAALVAVHDLDSAARLGDRMILMSEGRIAADGRSADVLEGPAVRQVLGVERRADGWQLVSAPEDPRSSP